MIQNEPRVIKFIHVRSLFSSVLLKPSSQERVTSPGKTKNERVRIRKEILEEKSSNNRTENTYYRARKIFSRWVVTERFWVMCDFWSRSWVESERVIRFRSSTTFGSFISFTFSYEKCFHSIICVSNQRKLRKVFRLIISYRFQFLRS